MEENKAPGNRPDAQNPWDRITIVLVTRNSGAILPTSLGSLPKAKRIILVDALSTDNTTAVAKECHPAVEVIPLAEDHGLGAATNQGLALVETEYVLNINPDTRMQEGCVEQLLRTADANPSAAGVAPVLTDGKGTIELYGMGPREIHHHKFPVLPEGPLCTWFLTGAVVLWRLSAIRAIDGFDENIFLYNEDTDISVRSTRAGFSLIIDTGATAEHFGGASEKATLKSRVRRDWNMVWGQLFYENKHGQPGEAETTAREYVSRCRRESLLGLLSLRPKKFLTNRAKARAAESFLRGDPPWGRK
ncbi:MAG: glycosyltransferase [Rhodospirillales bacterium]